MSPPKPAQNDPEPGVKVIAGERFLTLEKFAEVIGRTTRTVQRWNEQGFGPPRTKIGGLDLIPEKRIAGWMDSHTTEPVRPSRRRRTAADTVSPRADNLTTPAGGR